MADTPRPRSICIHQFSGGSDRSGSQKVFISPSRRASAAARLEPAAPDPAAKLSGICDCVYLLADKGGPHFPLFADLDRLESTLPAIPVVF